MSWWASPVPHNIPPCSGPFQDALCCQLLVPLVLQPPVGLQWWGIGVDSRSPPVGRGGMMESPWRWCKGLFWNLILSVQGSVLSCCLSGLETATAACQHCALSGGTSLWLVKKIHYPAFLTSNLLNIHQNNKRFQDPNRQEMVTNNVGRMNSDWLMDSKCISHSHVMSL